jgi:hypothetical protein
MGKGRGSQANAVYLLASYAHHNGGPRRERKEVNRPALMKSKAFLPADKGKNGYAYRVKSL